MATLSRRARDIIEEAFAAGADGGAASPLVTSRLHDFGFRGCTCPEQSVLGGCAHLLSFEGSDTLSAAYYAQVGGWARLRHVGPGMASVRCLYCAGTAWPAATWQGWRPEKVSGSMKLQHL